MGIRGLRHARRGGLSVAAAAGLGVLGWMAALGTVSGEAISVNPDLSSTIVFAPTQARFVRLLIHAASSAEPCLDELEVYGPSSEANLALADGGARATASSCRASRYTALSISTMDGMATTTVG